LEKLTYSSLRNTNGLYGAYFVAAKTAYAAAVVDNHPALFSFSFDTHGIGSADASAVAAADAGALLYLRLGGKGVFKRPDRLGEDKIKKLPFRFLERYFDMIGNSYIPGREAGIFYLAE